MPTLFKHRKARQAARLRLEAEKAEKYSLIQEVRRAAPFLRLCP